jgi:hypothetical protein
MTLDAEQFIRRFWPMASCVSVTSAFSPIEPKNTLFLNAESYWDLIPLCPKSPKDQPRISCWC